MNIRMKILHAQKNLRLQFTEIDKAAQQERKLMHF